ncbi:FAD-dependent oxidoreductase [Pseudohaliea rubra]|uniref:Protoporphyrinogen IX oxidase, aerobic, HemY n=1 Tax=Pseudohaliea rubra DSM 19751 TaxID=1265313 RepID=A0A095VNH2_9GAMM|nr:FAD-dependent oxidoreductase [Pseudohaliea rubra]KGE03017.1 Protoporphyrinogen IX oxidase, aerobic, HemY [Pseudohaliea rubra DSM 19751]
MISKDPGHLDRRHFLKLSGAGSALALSGLAHADTAPLGQLPPPWRPTVIVVGGGIAGLGAALRLREAGHAVVLLERDAEAGGRCRSVSWHGLWAVTGAFAFLGAESNLITLARKLDAYRPEQLLDLTAAHSWNMLVNRSELIDFGAFDLAAAATHPLIPGTEKLKLLATLPPLLRQALLGDPRDITSAVALDDVNACEYFRRYSPTFVDYYLEPTMGMFCGYGEDDYSLAWTAWSFTGRMSWSGSGNSMWSYRERGAGRLTWELARYLEADPGTELRLAEPVAALHYRENGVTVELERGGTLEAQAAVVAVPGNRVAGLLPGLDEERRSFFQAIDYAGHHIFYYLLDRPKGELADTYVLPAADGFRRTGNLRFTDLGDGRTFAHSQWKDWGCRQHAGASDAELQRIAWQDVQEAVPALAGTRLIDSFVSRQPHAICKRPKGYIAALQRFRELGPLPRLAFAGDYLTNSTVGQAHWSGLSAAEALLARLGSASAPLLEA